MDLAEDLTGRAPHSYLLIHSKCFRSPSSSLATTQMATW